MTFHIALKYMEQKLLKIQREMEKKTGYKRRLHDTSPKWARHEDLKKKKKSRKEKEKERQ